MVKYKALLLGCGNIGAMHDFENDYIQTHAKALYLWKKVDVNLEKGDIIKLNILYDWDN